MKQEVKDITAIPRGHPRGHFDNHSNSCQVCFLSQRGNGRSSKGFPEPTEGDQNMPPPNMLFWHFDYFELKAIVKTADIRVSLPSSSLLKKHKFAMNKVPSWYQKEENVLITGDESQC